MKIFVDMNICDHHGQCTIAAPDNFTLDEDGKLQYKADFPESDMELIEDAIDVCPLQAISLIEED